MGDTNLFEEFEPASREDWLQKIQKDLRDKFTPDVLQWDNGDGLSGSILYHQEDRNGQLDFAVDKSTDERNDWVIVQRIDGSDPTSSNKAAISALMQGATGLTFENLSGDQNMMESILKDIQPEAISLNLSPTGSPRELISSWLAWLQSQQTDLDAVSGCLLLDPIGDLLTSGNWKSDQNSDLKEVAEAMHDTESLTHFRVLNIRGDHYHNAGAGIIDEVAFTLAQFHEYIHQLQALGIPPDAVVGKVQLTLATGSDYFPEIAKLRAIRLLWQNVLKPYKVGHQTWAKLHAVSSDWTQSAMDPHVNLLRSTTQAMAAAIGGCDSLSIRPFDHAYKKSDVFSERLTRGIQLLLKEESYLDQVVDPASGSYYLESLTDQIAKEAWKVFQEVEQQGGYLEALKSGWIQEKVERSAENKRSRFKAGELTMVGTNKYIRPTDPIAPNELSDVDPVHEDTLIKPLVVFRLAQIAESMQPVVSDS